MEFSKVKIVTFVPSEHADVVRDAIGKAGAGQIGEYSFCSYSVSGVGRFLPSSNANPHIGKSGELEVVNEERIEVECVRSKAELVINAIKSAHPYEQVAFDVYPLLDVATSRNSVTQPITDSPH
ncbi:hypothetical protein IPF89_00470 [Candidatus Saccharibacteria bacterium]|nr:MAG: hypothetical protein IPF89_00470 [Candidatus Saccharibacteria bacterium]